MVQRSGVVTPEAVVLEFETAGVASRLLSGLLDGALQVALVLALATGFTLTDAAVSLAGAATAVMYVLVFLVMFGYPAAAETLWRGRTVGKAALGLRVVTTEGAPVRFRHAAIRSILSLVDKLLFAGLVGVVAVLLTPRNQRLGDLVAGTLVLRERTGAPAPRAVRFFAPPGLEAYVATLDPAGVRADDYVAVRSFLLRAATLPPGVRHQLAAQLAGPLAARLRTVPPPGVAPEVFLACVAAASQRRDGGAAPSERAQGGVPAATMASVWERAELRSGPPVAATPSPAPTAGGFTAPD